jgi:hypothetical protein
VTVGEVDGDVVAGGLDVGDEHLLEIELVSILTEVPPEDDVLGPTGRRRSRGRAGILLDGLGGRSRARQGCGGGDLVLSGASILGVVVGCRHLAGFIGGGRRAIVGRALGGHRLLVPARPERRRLRRQRRVGIVEVERREEAGEVELAVVAVLRGRECVLASVAVLLVGRVRNGRALVLGAGGSVLGRAAAAAGQPEEGRRDEGEGLPGAPELDGRMAVHVTNPRGGCPASAQKSGRCRRPGQPRAR